MINDINTLTLILTAVIITIIVLIAVLCVVYFIARSKKVKSKEQNIDKKEIKEIPKSKTFGVESVFDFIEFDKIEDNMILQKDGAKYIMVVECQGVNYDLMSEVEKNAVEEGFIQFLNTIRYPIQIYTQTRTINLESSIQTYKDRVREIDENLQKQESNYNDMVKSGRYTKEQLDQAYYELTKNRNLSEYGKDIIYTTERMSLNKNVLNQKYYVIVPYYPEDLGDNDFDKEEIKNMAFSELYTRSQSIISTLSVCGVNGRILSSNDLVELLYVAYNRDESEVYGLDKALNAEYDALYSTAPDVLDKKMKELDRQIEQQAYEKANAKVYEAKSEKQKALEEKENNIDDLVDELAKFILSQNSGIIGDDIAEKAIEKIDEDKAKKKRTKSNENKKGGTEDNVKKTKRRTTKTA